MKKKQGPSILVVVPPGRYKDVVVPQLAAEGARLVSYGALKDESSDGLVIDQHYLQGIFEGEAKFRARLELLMRRQVERGGVLVSVGWSGLETDEVDAAASEAADELTYRTVDQPPLLPLPLPLRPLGGTVVYKPGQLLIARDPLVQKLFRQGVSAAFSVGVDPGRGATVTVAGTPHPCRTLASVKGTQLVLGIEVEYGEATLIVLPWLKLSSRETIKALVAYVKARAVVLSAGQMGRPALVFSDGGVEYFGIPLKLTKAPLKVLMHLAHYPEQFRPHLEIAKHAMRSRNMGAVRRQMFNIRAAVRVAVRRVPATARAEAKAIADRFIDTDDKTSRLNLRKGEIQFI